MQRIHICNDTILYCRASKLTVLSTLSQHPSKNTRQLARNIFLSHLLVGRSFAKRVMRGDPAFDLQLFVAYIACMPLVDHSVDVCFHFPRS